MTRTGTVRLLVLVATMAWALVPAESATAALPKGDVVFILDESGSMGDEIADVRASISAITAQAAKRIDARYALVGFGGGSPGVPANEPFTRTDFTTAAGLKAAVQSSGAFPGGGGGREMGLDATAYAMTSLTGFRADAAVCAVVVSDEPPSFRTDEAADLRGATAALAARSATWFGVVDTADAVVRRTYGPDPGSLAASSAGATLAMGEFRRDPSSVLGTLTARCSRALVNPQQPVGEARGPANPKCTIRGTSGPDVLRGTPGRDVICGFGGDDVISARGGDDLVRGGAGKDVLRGGRGADRLTGGTGDDKLFGGAGKDVLRGQGGRDRLWAADGRRDRVYGGAGFDVGVVDRGLERLRSIERAIRRSLR